MNSHPVAAPHSLAVAIAVGLLAEFLVCMAIAVLYVLA